MAATTYTESLGRRVVARVEDCSESFRVALRGPGPLEGVHLNSLLDKREFSDFLQRRDVGIRWFVDGHDYSVPKQHLAEFIAIAKELVTRYVPEIAESRGDST